NYAKNSGNRLLVMDTRHYKDSTDTIVVRISQANGSVTEINFDNIEEIQDINYCFVNGKNPITTYPLFDQYILVTYTHATNTSDNTTFTDRGMVLDWSGNIISPKKGFLRLSMVTGTNYAEWKQYGYKGNGIFYLLQNDTLDLDLSLNSLLTTFATLNGGYALVYANTSNGTASNNTLAAQFTADAGLYAIMLNYNQTKTNKTIILHEMSTPNVKISFSTLYCSIDNVFVGHTCIVAGIPVQNVSTSTPTPFYIKVRFLSTGSVFKLESIFNIPLSSGIAIIRAMPFGGYALISRSYNVLAVNFNFSLYDDYNNQSNWMFPWQPIIANLVGVFDILGNNTMLIALNETSTSWNLFSIDLPRLAPYYDIGYGNMQVNSTYPPKDSNGLALNSNKISITYQNPVLLADGILYIYQKTSKGDVLRQSIKSKTCDASECNILNNVVTLYVLNCTFNQPGGQYYIQIDNNFVMSADDRESILGIEPNLWNFQTDNSTTQSKQRDVSIQGKLRLTTKGSLHFQGLNGSEKHEFLINLINDLVFIIPTEEGRLSSNERNQIDTSSTESKILISLSINEAKSGEITATVVKNYLNLLIINKESTNVSTGSTTMYLDETYGFQEAMTISDFLESHKIKLISFFVIIVVLLMAFLIAKSKSPE
ncbi:10915_t:CDS:2, partial [Dentiscutata heterogama]